jgi:hypothetical protein
LDAGRGQTLERNLNDEGEVQAVGADSQVKTVESERLRSDVM